MPDRTDQAVRLFLDQNGRSMDDLSEFVDDAVRRRIFELTVSKDKDRNEHFDQNELMALVDEEVDAVRESQSWWRLFKRIVTTNEVNVGALSLPMPKSELKKDSKKFKTTCRRHLSVDSGYQPRKTKFSPTKPPTNTPNEGSSGRKIQESFSRT